MSILKHVSGSNRDPDYINVLVDYMTENRKTADGLYVDTYGCSKTNPVRDIDAVKKIHQLPHTIKVTRRTKENL